jgi:hypothetical protein
MMPRPDYHGITHLRDEDDARPKRRRLYDDAYGDAVHVRDNASGKYPRAQAMHRHRVEVRRFLNPNAATQQRSHHGRWQAEIDSLASMRTFLAIPLSTSAIPPSKTALIISRGLINWYCIVRGVKCPISNLGGFTVPNSIVRGVI